LTRRSAGRRDEEKSRAKERIFSFRDSRGQWDPKKQRPEPWNLFNRRIEPGESLRIFPLSNWTELDIWQYIHLESIPIVPLYFAKERLTLVREDSLIPIEQPFVPMLPGEKPQIVKCRMRSIGCSPVYWRDTIRSRHAPQDHRGTHFVPTVRARKPRHRS
jgi:sulfate adenylyltransferase subunit 2